MGAYLGSERQQRKCVEERKGKEKKSKSRYYQNSCNLVGHITDELRINELNPNKFVGPTDFCCFPIVLPLN
jgi:hypothetical protein